MVKRDKVVPGTVVQVIKLPPGPAGPNFTGKFALHEKLDIISKPFSSGGMHLVKVRREKNDATFDVMYAFITNYCRMPTTKKSNAASVADTLHAPPEEEGPTLVPDGTEPDLSDRGEPRLLT